MPSMNDIKESDLLTGVLGVLYQKLTMGDDDSIRKNNQFFAWLPAGIALSKNSLKFMTGLMGEAPLSPQEILAAQKVLNATKDKLAAEEAIANGEDAQNFEAVLSEADKIYAKEYDAHQRLMAASQMYEVLNQVPDVPNFVNGEPRATVLAGTENHVVDVYKNILKFSETASYKMTDEEKAKIVRLRGLMTEKYEEKDLITEEVVVKYRKSKLLADYEKYMTEWENAYMELKNVQIAANAGLRQGAAMEFAMKGSMLKKREQAAFNNLVTLGRKHDVEKVAAFIEGAGLRDAGLIRQELLGRLRSNEMLAPDGSSFYMTNFAPTSFLEEESGWMSFTFDSTDFENNYSSKNSSTSGSVNAGTGLWSAKVAAGYSQSSDTADQAYSNFKMSVKFTMVNINRQSFFDFAFVRSNMWRFLEGMDMISDGGTPPTGEMPALATRAILIKDLEMSYTDSSGEQHSSSKSTSVSGSGGFGFGPFKFGASAAHNSTSQDGGQSGSHMNQTLGTDGMQLIGYLCTTLPKVPNPLVNDAVTWSVPDIADEVLQAAE